MLRYQLIFMSLFIGLTGCRTIRDAKYGAMEKFGVHKRDILVDRVEEAKDAQKDASVAIEEAYKRLARLTDFEGGDLEAIYNRMKKSLDQSQTRVKAIDSRLNAVETVSGDLFKEWKTELNEYTNPKLKANSERQLRDTRARYDKMMTAMTSARKKVDPVMAVLSDHTLFLKHNLNAQSVGALKSEVAGVEKEVAALIKEMQSAISDAESFIKSMGT